MDERNVQKHLLRDEVQERVRQNIQRSRIEATVTIGRAASLFGFSESKLRDLEASGHLSPLRSKDSKGQRQYSLNELVKLAVIRELLNARYTVSEIPHDIDTIWYALQTLYEERIDAPSLLRPAGSNDVTYHLSINQRLDDARANLIWRYFVSRALRLSLGLIREDIPNTMAGLVLPLYTKLLDRGAPTLEELAEVGESLVGWLGRSSSSHVMLTPAPFFLREDNAYHVLRLQTMKNLHPEEPPEDDTLILIDRRVKKLTLTAPIVETIRKLLAPIYEDPYRSRVSFGMGMCDLLDPSTDLYGSTQYADMILNGLAEIAVRLGGMSVDGSGEEQSRWRFSCILLPNFPDLSMQQRGLVVKAQSKNSPHKEGVTTLPPQGAAIGLCIRAYQSGHVIYFPDVSPIDTTIALHELEEPLRSAIAIPIEGSGGLPIAVLYVVSDLPDAFPASYQRVLRVLARMVGEAIETYAIRLQRLEGLSKLITAPTAVDPLFKEFASETEFIGDIERLLLDIQAKEEEENLSFIAIDIDNQSSLANKYGDLVTRKLSREVGKRILGQLRAFKDNANYSLYHVYADRFYILLDGMTLDQAGAKAELLRLALRGSYRIDPLHTSIDQVTLPENMVQLQDITVRLGVSSYLYSKVREILQRCDSDQPQVETRVQIVGFLDEELDMGKREGGDAVISWDRRTRGFKRLLPSPAAIGSHSQPLLD